MGCQGTNSTHSISLCSANSLQSAVWFSGPDGIKLAPNQQSLDEPRSAAIRKYDPVSFEYVVKTSDCNSRETIGGGTAAALVERCTLLALVSIARYVIFLLILLNQDHSRAISCSDTDLSTGRVSGT